MLLAHVRDTLLLASSSPNIEGWLQISELGLAFVLSMVVGVEREIRQKSAGLRTHVLVGVGAALFVLISKYGFSDVVRSHLIVVDPSRMAAQIVSGVGFLGAGLIFVRRDSVRGLTTAAAVWVTAAIGAASGAGLPILAIVTTVIYLIVATAFPRLTRLLPHSSTVNSVIRVRYPDGQGILRQILKLATSLGFTLSEISAETTDSGQAPYFSPTETSEHTPMVLVTLEVRGRSLVNELVAALADMKGVTAVLADDMNAANE